MRRGRCVSPSESCQKDPRRSHHGGAVGKPAAPVCCATGCHAGTFSQHHVLAVGCVLPPRGPAVLSPRRPTSWQQ